MNGDEVRKALKKASRDPEYDLSGDLMAQAVIGDETCHFKVTAVEEGGVNPLFPYLKLEEI